jgi:hypothetical protein
MNASRALRVLYQAENRLNDRFARVVNLLKAPPRVSSLLLQNQKRPGGDQFNRLWQTAAGVAAKFHIKRRDTDWVFENFWPNAAEPKHSKLLGFFLDPQELHGCGPFLLEKFLSLLETTARGTKHRNPKAEPRFIADGCIVKAEREYIDLRIERERDDGKFAIIIENKINKACDQYGFRISVGREASQLETYVERLLRRGFHYHEIYVFYLPLEGWPDP